MIIDFHSHILPGMDHGCADLPMSLNQLLAAKNAGVELIAATSHFYPHRDTVESFLYNREISWGLLKESLPEDAPKVFLGAEVLLCEGMEHMEGLEKLTLESGVLLLEMPFGGWNQRLRDSLEAIHYNMPGKMVLAHVDRYPPKDVEPLLRVGMMGQLNASNICRHFGRSQLLKWVDEGFIVALGSDTHGVGKSFEQLQKAVSILGDRYAPIEEASLRLISGQTAETIKTASV